MRNRAFTIAEEENRHYTASKERLTIIQRQKESSSSPHSQLTKSFGRKKGQDLEGILSA